MHLPNVPHEAVSASTSYGVGLLALLFQQDMGTYAAFFGLILVLVRIIGDIPRALLSWREYMTKRKDKKDGHAK